MDAPQSIITLLDSKISHDKKGLERLKKISNLSFVTKVIALPDFHLKEKMEAPSSIAVAVKDHIVSHFSSSSLNCGMGALNTSIHKEDMMKNKNLTSFFNLFRKTKEDKKYDLNPSELEGVMLNGAKFLLEKYNLDREILDKFENNGGTSIKSSYEKQLALSSIFKEDLYDNSYIGLKNLGLGLGGNHFLEIQVVDKIYDNEICKKNNIELNKIVVMYHGGGGIVPGFIGAFFAKRKKGMDNDIKFLYNKLKFHFQNKEAIFNFRKIWKYYFSNSKFIGIPLSEKEGERVFIANKVSMNYGYAYRLAFIARIKDTFSKIFGNNLKIFPMLDVSHNTIQEEIINGEKFIIHRHNTAHLLPNEIAILPGFHTTHSYIGIGLDNLPYYLNSIPHGAGYSIKKYKELDIAKEISNSKTYKYICEDEEPILVNHITDEGIDRTVELLYEKKLFKPIARVLPLGVLKNYHY